jgi:hypothetical protein
MVNKIQVSPAKTMVNKMAHKIHDDGSCWVHFFEDDRALIDEFYLVQGHTLKKGPNDSLVFFSLGYANEIPLPNAGYHLYNFRSLTIPLVPQEEARRHSVSDFLGRIT